MLVSQRGADAKLPTFGKKRDKRPGHVGVELVGHDQERRSLRGWFPSASVGRKIQTSHDERTDELGRIAADPREIDDQYSAVIHEFAEIHSGRGLPHESAHDWRGERAQLVKNRGGHLRGKLLAQGGKLLDPEDTHHRIGDS